MSAPLTEAAIQQMRDMIAGGRLSPGSRLPSESELAIELGASRNTVREAVRALVTARVLDVRRGDGTYVTSLRPELLLEGVAAAVELMQAGFSLELIAVRRILEPPATAMAAARIEPDVLDALDELLARMDEAESQGDRIGHDAAFHALIATTSGNATLASMLAAVSSRTIRARAWRGLVQADAGRERMPSTGRSLRRSGTATRTVPRPRRSCTWPPPRPGSVRRSRTTTSDRGAGTVRASSAPD